jgi:hypothetical protein
MFHGFLSLIDLREEGGIKIVALTILSIAWGVFPERIISWLF